MSPPKSSARIIESLRNADLEPEVDKKVTLRQLVYLEADSFQAFLNAGKCIYKICTVLAEELEQEVQPSTFRTYLRDALKAKKRGGAGGRGSSSARRVPKRPARLSLEAPAQITEGQPALGSQLAERRAAHSPSNLLEYDGTVLLPSSTPSAPR